MVTERFNIFLLNDESTEEKYTRLSISSSKLILRFIIDFGSCEHILYTNYPVNGIYSRSEFHPIKLIKDKSLLSVYSEILIDHPGAYQYYVSYKHRTLKAGYFVIEPRIVLPNHIVLPLDGIQLLTVVPKWMGDITQWTNLLQQASDSNYNMIHFVPMQKRGISNSPFSIDNPLLFSDDLFPNSMVSNEEKIKLIESTINTIYSKHGILSLSDVVWNHVSNNSELLYEHPEIGYNLHNSPHLIPSYELDSALMSLSDCMEDFGLPSDIKSPEDIDKIISYIEYTIFPCLKLYEYKWIHIDEQIQDLRKYYSNHKKADQANFISNIKLEEDMMQLLNEKIVVDGHLGTRYHKSLDYQYAISLLLALNPTNQMTDNWIDTVCSQLYELLEKYNTFQYVTYQQDVKIALRNIKDRLFYTQLNENGPKLGSIDKKNPIVESYFVHLNDVDSMHPKGSMILACNGWLWDLDPLQDFTGPESPAYLRRDLVVWNDCVKLRYGRFPKDNPWLWQHMRDYTETIAGLFHGIRIDNCHSTPLHVSEYLLDAARKIQPNLYVLAELFTGSPRLDILFVSRLGIHALIREAMHSTNAFELSKLVRLYHGSSPRALFMDCTHDNETPFQRRTAKDALPNAAIVAFSGCAVGSVKGYDEIYPKRLDIVNESRLYAVNNDSSMIKAKSQLLDHRQKMLSGGYLELNVTQEHDFVMIHRTHPKSEQGYLLIARTAFTKQKEEEEKEKEERKEESVVNFRLERTRIEYMFGYSLGVKESPMDIVSSCIQGFESHLETLGTPSLTYNKDQYGDFVHIDISSSLFTPGSIYVLKTSICNWSIQDFEFISTIVDDVTKDLDLLDCNVILYRCQSEEIDSTGHGVYVVPDIGPLVYAGLQGFMSVLPDDNGEDDNKDHRYHRRHRHHQYPIVRHLLQGDWAFDYLYQRLERYQSYQHLIPLINWLKSRVSLIKEKLAKPLLPKYFKILVTTVYEKVYHHAISLMSSFIQSGDEFVQALAMTSVQTHGLVPSASLAPQYSVPTLAAGLPHFTEGAMRVWGRDVFISLFGLFLITGQPKVVRRHLVGFARVLYNGLIPNLLDSQKRPRYNARDAVWFFMQALQDYYHVYGSDILDEVVNRRFLKSNGYVNWNEQRKEEEEEEEENSCTIAEIMQEIMEKHAHGIHFREHLAGPMIDAQMTDQGFNIDIEVDWNTGVIVGGNRWNCGTWMDKMGSSVKADNKGCPATPRDGAPIEITGLLKSALRWINQLVKKGEYQWDRVCLANGETITFKQWEELLQLNFERIYYIPQDPSKDKYYEIISEVVHRRGIYKDVYNSSEQYTEYQLRPNFLIAMTVAPELFEKSHAQQAIMKSKEILLSKLGMRSLDFADLQYRPFYRNAEETNDFRTSNGFNYHQGPEWLWPIGYFLRSASYFDVLEQSEMSNLLLAHKNCLFKNDWRGLPELTNKDGEFCNESCPNQSWSSATLLEFLYYESKKKKKKTEE